MKRDQLIQSGSAIAHLQDLHRMMRESLKATKRMVSFMDFDIDGPQGAKTTNFGSKDDIIEEEEDSANQLEQPNSDSELSSPLRKNSKKKQVNNNNETL